MAIRVLALVCFLVFGAVVIGAEPLVIDEYEFTWKVAESGKLKLYVQKDNETTRIRFWDESDMLHMTPADAKLVGDALSQTDKYLAKFKGSKEDVSEAVEAGDQRVLFTSSPKYGFSVLIRDKGRSFSSISLDRKQCLAIAPHLKRAEEMAAHADKVVDTALAPKK